MGFQWTFGRKLGAGFLLAGATLLLVAAAGYRSSVRQGATAAWVSHTHAVRRDLATLLRGLSDAETGERGYIITGDESYLEPYHAALALIGPTLDHVQQLTADNEAQQRSLGSARSLADERLAVLARMIALRKSEGFDATSKGIARSDGKTVMDQLRQILGEMDHREEVLLEERDLEAAASEGTTRAIIFWGTLLGLGLVSAAGGWISRSLSSEVAAAVGNIRSSSAELQTAANQQATGAREQATAVSQIATTIAELLATCRQIAESARRVAQIAGQTTTSARAGDATVELGHEAVAGMRRQVDLIVSHMLELGRKSQQIGAVLDIVAELAEQTNILAINATIEAAGAGDAGNRFAVVADEIRKLADRVTGSAKEIRGLIDDVRSSVNTTVMTTETGSKAVDANSRQFAEVAAAFERIRDLVSTTTEAAKEIELSTQQQSAAAEQVSIAITSIAQSTRETEASTAQTFQTASQLTRLSGELIRLVHPQAA